MLSLLRKPLALSLIYDVFQDTLGAQRAKQRILQEFILDTNSPQSCLDLGCGTASLRKCLSADIRYTGIDFSPSYIAKAKQNCEDQDQLVLASITDLTKLALPQFDIILCIGVTHHLSDSETIDLYRNASQLLTQTGKILVCDPCTHDEQSPLQRWVIQQDRGEFIRSPNEQLALVRQSGLKVEHQSIKQDLLRIPYSHHVLRLSSI